MATTTSFKQECPSCEALVPIKDATLVGRKIDCPKCKFRFKVEAPPAVDEIDEVDEAEETPPPAKNGKTIESKGTNGKSTAVKPANGKATNGKVTDKPSPVAKNGKAGAKKAKDDDDARLKKKKKSGSSMTLILGGGLGLVAVVGLVVAGICFWPSSDKGKATNNSPAPGQPGPGPKDGDKPKDNEDNKPKDPVIPPPSIADVSNLLPNDTEIVVAFNAPGILSSSLRRAAFMTPGAFQDVNFRNCFGFGLEDVQRIIQAHVPTQGGVFCVIRTIKPFARPTVTTCLKLDRQPPVNNLEVNLVKAHFDGLGNFLVKGNQGQETYVHILDDYTLVFANKPIMNQFLVANARPKYQTQSSAPPVDNKPSVPPSQPNQGTPVPQPGTKMSSVVRPEESGVEVFVKDGTGQFVAYQGGFQPGPGGPGGGPGGRPGGGPGGPGAGSGGPGVGPGGPGVGPGGPGGGPGGPGVGPGGPGGPGVGPGGPGRPGGGPGGPGSGPGGPGSGPGGPGTGPGGPGTGPGGPGTGPGGPGTGPGGPGTGPGGPGTGPGGPGTGPSGPGGGPNPNPPPPSNPPSGSYMTVPPDLKRVLDKVESAEKPALIVVATRGNTKLGAEIGQRFLDAIPPITPTNPSGGFGHASEKELKSKADPFRDVQVMAFSISLLFETKLVATAAIEGRDEKSRADMEKTVRSIGVIIPAYFKGMFDLDVSGIPPEVAEPGSGTSSPYPSTPIRGPEGSKGRDGSVTLNKVDTTLVLSLEMTLNEKAYRYIMYKMGESSVQLKSHAELADARSHVHELAAALQEYVKNEKDKAFPHGTVDRPPTVDRPVGFPPEKRLSWMTELLPYLGNGNYRNVRFNPNATWQENENFLLAQMIVPEFLARTRTDQPAVVRHPSSTTPLAATHFVGMSGLGFDAADFRAGDKAVADKLGVFGYERVTKLSELRNPDKTIVVIQVDPKFATPWIAGGGSTIRGVSDDPTDPEGAVIEPFVCTEMDGKKGTIAIMGDGKVRFIPKSISNADFRQLCTISGPKPSASIDTIAPLVPPPEDGGTLKGQPLPVDPGPGPGNAPKPPVGWQEYSNPAANCALFFPKGNIAKEERSDAKTGIKATDLTLKDEPSGRMYIATLADIGEEGRALGSLFLDIAIKGQAFKNAKAINEKKITLEPGHPGLECDAVIQPGVRTWARGYVVNTRAYLLFVVGPDNPETAQTVAVYFNSFHLLKPVPVAALPKTTWKEVVSKEGRFTALLPEPVGEPQTKKETEPFERTEISLMSLSAELKHMFGVNYADLGPKEATAGADAVFALMRADLTKPPKEGSTVAKITGEKKITLGTYPGVELRFDLTDQKNPGKKMQAVARLYLAKTRIYTVVSVAFEGSLDEKESGKFFDSFKIMADGKPDEKPK